MGLFQREECVFLYIETALVRHSLNLGHASVAAAVLNLHTSQP